MSVVLSTKVLVPLAVAAAAGALAVGSGADFTSASGNTASSVTSGTLTQSNSKANAAVYNLTNMKPGDVLNGTVVITNTGSLPANMALTEGSVTNGFSAGVLTEKIVDSTTGAVLYNGAFGGAGKVTINSTAGSASPAWAANEAHTITMTVTLAQSATNADQGKSASAAFTWDGTQTSATTYNQ